MTDRGGSAHDSGDDPDDVTLWSGRLRPWPSVPVHPEDVPEADTVRSAHADLDDTVRSPRRPDSPGAADADDTVVGGPVSPASPLVLDPADEATIAIRPAAPPSAGSGAAAVDDETRTVRRGREASTPEPGDGGSPDDVDDDTSPRADRLSARDRGEDDVTATRARGATATIAPHEPSAPSGEHPGRAALRRAATPAIVDEAAERVARVPEAQLRERYAPRVEQPVRVARQEPPARRADAPDAALVRPRSSGRARVRIVVLSALVALILVGAAVTLVIVTL